MGRSAIEPASPSTLAPALLRWLAEHGAEVQLPKEDELPITARALAELLDQAAQTVREPHVALRLPRELVYRRYDPVALAAQAAGTPADVLSVHARWAPLVFPQLEAEVTQDALAIRFTARLRGQPRGLGIAVDEYLAALLLHRCRRGAELPSRRVFFTSARPRDIAPLFGALGTRDVIFGNETFGLELLLADARQPLPGGDPTLLATAEHLASAVLDAAPRPGALRESVAVKIDAALPGDVSADAVASRLHMSARTLQRRLEAEGTRFSEVLDAVRERRARRLLEEALPLAEIAHRSGFADLATFSRAFKRWTGVPPGAYRKARRDRAGDL